MAPGEAQTYTEPGEFAAGILGAKVDLAIPGPGHFDASIWTVHLNSFRIQMFSVNLPLVAHMRDLGGRASFIFHNESVSDLIRDGNEVNEFSMVRVGTPQSHFQRSVGPIKWGVISLPIESLTSAQIWKVDLTPPQSDQIITPRPKHLSNLRRLQRMATMVAVEAPELIINPESVRGMEQILMQALIGCLDSGDVREQTSAQRRHHEIMQRFHSVLMANPGRALYVLEMAEAVGASLRSLSVCCQEHLGIGPKKYLLLRRMHLARQALSSANSSVSTVTDVATQYGFWQFGRFAGRYKELFGESPSVTLHRPRTKSGAAAMPGLLSTPKMHDRTDAQYPAVNARDNSGRYSRPTPPGHFSRTEQAVAGEVRR